MGVRSAAAFLIAVLAGCGTSRTGAETGDTGVLPADSGDGGDAADDAAGPEVGLPDATETLDTGDAGDAPDDADAGAELGAPCSDDAACASGFCIDVVSGTGVCALPCATDEQCPRDFDCVLLGSGTDAERACLSRDLCIDADRDLHGIGPGCRGIDCDDADPGTNVSADERCDGNDNDCDGETDEFPIDAGARCETGFPGECAAGRLACDGGLLGCVADNVPEPETCDSRDNDCDSETDEAAPGVALFRTCYDGDLALPGTGVCAEGLQTCQDGGYSSCRGQVLASGEVCDGLDNDCDGDSDEDLALTDWYRDADEDTFGDLSSAPTAACARPDGFVENRGDCDDMRAEVRPGVAEIPGDQIDQNCDGAEICFADGDGDGFRPPGAASAFSPDGDCTDEGEATADSPAGDCDDARAGVNPAAPELCDGVNNDCDERIDEGAACYPLGHACLEDIDCTLLLCEAGVCTRPLTCRDLGTCPDRLAATSGGVRVSSPRFRLSVSAPSGVASPLLNTTRYSATVGAGAFVQAPHP